ncbi:MAG: hypothetical protein ACWGHO_02715 [Candidatus Moraniibacteriota bacterium]
MENRKIKTRKLNRSRLTKLVFWIIHIIAMGSLLAGFFAFLKYEEMEDVFLRLGDECFKDTNRGNFDYCSVYYDHISDYSNFMVNCFIFGFATLIVYWIIKWVYKYLFTEESKSN